MHELHLVRNLHSDIIEHAKNNNASKVTKIFITMGEFTEINEDILTHYFNEESKATVIEGAEIIIEKSPTRELRLVSFECE